MSTQHIQILRYLWAGLRLDSKAVTAPNGNLVQRVRYQTLIDLQHHRWIEPDETRDGYYRLTAEGEARALVKLRVRDFLAQLSKQPTQPT